MRLRMAGAVLSAVLLGPAWCGANASAGEGGERPPTGFLASANGEVAGLLGSFCWHAVDAPGLCADTLPLDPADVLVVDHGETLTLRFETPEVPIEVTVVLFDGPGGTEIDRLSVPAGNPAEFSADFPTGVAVLLAFTRWDRGDASYYFEIDVGAETPVADPIPAPPTFTG